MLSHFSPVQLFATPWTAVHQAPLTVGFSRQEYWNGLPSSPPGDLPYPGTEPASLVSPALAGGFHHTTWEAPCPYPQTNQKLHFCICALLSDLMFLSFFFFFFKYLFIWLLGVLTVACGISLKQSNSGGKSQGTAQTWVWIPPSAD